jgi:hypothetical protein
MYINHAKLLSLLIAISLISACGSDGSRSGGTSENTPSPQEKGYQNYLNGNIADNIPQLETTKPTSPIDQANYTKFYHCIENGSIDLNALHKKTMADTGLTDEEKTNYGNFISTDIPKCCERINLSYDRGDTNAYLESVNDTILGRKGESPIDAVAVVSNALVVRCN